ILLNKKSSIIKHFVWNWLTNIIYIIDVSGGDKIPRKGWPSLEMKLQKSELIVRRLSTRLLHSQLVMERDALRMPDGGPFFFAQVSIAPSFSCLIAFVYGELATILGQLEQWWRVLSPSLSNAEGLRVLPSDRGMSLEYSWSTPE
ncbi:hypothetical protein D5086_005579, partial [Populus alba]